MNPKQFQYLSEVARWGSFSKASEELNISQPSLSQFVKRMEQELGVPLLNRSGGDVRLTDAGRIYLETGKRMMDEERKMKNLFSDLKTGKIGTITVGIAPTRCQYLMPSIVSRFSKLYPGMHLVIEERFIGELLEDAAHGAFDLCVATLPVDHALFEYELMMSEEVVLAVPQSSDFYEKATAAQQRDKNRAYPVIDASLLAGAHYVSLSSAQPTQVLLQNFCEALHFQVHTVVQCMSIETQFSMVKDGIGVALIPSSLAKYAQADGIAYFSLLQDIPKREMAVIYRKGEYLSEAILALKKIMTTI